MVVQRTLAKIEELKERPHHERRTIALYWAVGIVAVLIVFWGFFAVRTIGRTAIELTRQQNIPKSYAETASAAAADSVMLGAPPELTASSTNGYIDLIPASQSAPHAAK